MLASQESGCHSPGHNSFDMDSVLTIREEGGDAFAEHGRIPIGFWVSSRVDVRVFTESGELIELPTEPFFKDYDAFGEERPENLGRHFDLRTWVLLAAYIGNERVGGAILAWQGDYALLENREDLSAMVDIRVHPDRRGVGIGRALFERAIEWARAKGCREIRIETQDTNVGACRFYKAVGGTLHEIAEGAYLPELDEARIIWKVVL
jgi:GNAT superfamily N-acetyltransferase